MAMIIAWHQCQYRIRLRARGVAQRGRQGGGDGRDGRDDNIIVGRCFGLGLPAQACPTFPHPPAPPMGGDAGGEFLELSTHEFFLKKKEKYERACEEVCEG